MLIVEMDGRMEDPTKLQFGPTSYTLILALEE